MVITNDQEYRVGVKNTRHFINANVTEVELKRPTITTTDAGGKVRGAPDTLPLQRFRIVPMSGLVWDRSKTTPDEGNVPDVTEIMVGLPDADIEKGDYFAHGSGWFKVDHVSPVTGYRKEARLRYYNSEPIA